MNFLIVDDHPCTVAGHVENLGAKHYSCSENTFFRAFSCEQAYAIIKNNTIEIALIDYGLPPYLDKELFSGGDVARLLKKTNPNCKIIVITAHTEVLLIYEIFKNTKPDGLIIKNDLTPENLPDAVQSVMQGTMYHSEMVKKALQDIWKRDLMIQDVNRQIIMYLSKGYKIKEIERITELSMSAIQRRIAHMKDAFDVSEESSIVKEAYLQGFL